MMNSQNFAAQLREIISQIKQDGTAAIYCDTLITYLDEVAKSPSQEPTETELAQYKAELQLQIEQNKNYHLSALEMFRSVITAGQNAIRSSFLLNGGASIALLAFISHLAQHQPAKVATFSSALLPFVIGVLVITMASGFTYLSQWLYDNACKKIQKAGFCFNIVSIVLGLSSYGFFIWGMYRAFMGFNTFV